MSHSTRPARSGASPRAASARSPVSSRSARDSGPTASLPASQASMAAVQGSAPAPELALAALNEAQSKFIASWIAQIHAAQLVWLDLAKTLPATCLLPFGFRLKAPAAEVTEAQDVADSAASGFALTLERLSMPGPWSYWFDASRQAHTEEVVA